MKPNQCVKTISVRRQSAVLSDAVSVKEVNVQCPFFEFCRQINSVDNETEGHCEQYEPVLCVNCGAEVKDKTTFPLCNSCDELGIEIDGGEDEEEQLSG